MSTETPGDASQEVEATTEPGTPQNAAEIEIDAAEIERRKLLFLRLFFLIG